MRRVLALLAVAVFAACSQQAPGERSAFAPDEAAANKLINDAAAALGGAERLRSVKTIVIEGAGNQYNLGQDLTPEASGQTFAFTQYKRAIDVAGDRALTELTRAPHSIPPLASRTFMPREASQSSMSCRQMGVRSPLQSIRPRSCQPA